MNRNDNNMPFPFRLFGMDIPEANASYRQAFRCFSFAMYQGEHEKGNLEYGAKILMPPSALEELSHMNIQYPMLFCIRNKHLHRETHCGVLEFIAEEGQVFIPYWMMRNLLLNEGDIVEIELASLPVAKFVKFQPQSPEFLDIGNPKVVLEKVLRNFATLTTDDVIPIKHGDKIYELRVLETKPENAVSIIETDTEVDFAPPLGYVEPERKPMTTASTAPIERDIETKRVMDEMEHKTFTPFKGSGTRINGKISSSMIEPQKPQLVTSATIGIPNYNFTHGKITFFHNLTSNQKARTASISEAAQAKEKDDVQPFTGAGSTIRTKRRP